jgi:putative oxidoreductase
MRKYVSLAAGILLGLCFLFASSLVLFNLIDPSKFPGPPEGSPAWHFMQAFGASGYIKFVKIFEFVGALLVMVPRLRNIGLLLLGPVIVNIVAYHVLMDDWRHIFTNGMLDVILVCSLYLLWDARQKFSGLLN